jgi:diaminopimelate decarboxylase
MFGEAFPGGKLGIRFNPGLGSGHHTFANVGGRGSSFGIWHSYAPEVLKLAQQYKLRIYRIHTHIGSGVDPEVWERVAALTLDLARQCRDVTHVNLGGGFKIARMPTDKATNVQECGNRVRGCFEAFAKETGRQLHLEIEPGTFLVANAGCLVARVEDVVDTGPEGHGFVKLNCGMGEIMRPVLYGAQHPIIILNQEQKLVKHVVVGHCCESGDALSMGTSGIEARELSNPRRGDFAVIEGCGAYCASMSVVNYNSYPQAPEVLLIGNRLEVIRVRQTMEQMLVNERPAKL